MSDNFFLNALIQRAQDIQIQLVQLEIKEINILLSGGSTSSLVLHVFDTLRKKNELKLPLSVTYLQFDRFVWFERQAAREIALQFETPLNVINMTGLNINSDQIWQTIDKNLNFGMVGGHGWPTFTRQSADLSQAGIAVIPKRNSLENRIDFFTPKEWHSFLQDPKTKLFFELWSSVPFQNLRYWQDYVFKGALPEFKPTMKWDLGDVL